MRLARHTWLTGAIFFTITCKRAKTDTMWLLGRLKATQVAWARVLLFTTADQVLTTAIEPGAVNANTK